ncbi:alpha/beta fold hydrolase [Peribacillus cavernae]|uniref:Alpha/beta fold hydrolase n=1 Tax=Peribacillus cavernae TaxID=1674310 RepID=A0A3S0UC75_9BACI|nr:alpha/beta fold hydrolase [Peribacillus cavernae]MDQ0217672.1 homoserine O-acetyltransferase [Peribacillus cavernae]RUQ28145.1 alpha/beta fold hydrolase [Peribacillus cavernae]
MIKNNYYTQEFHGPYELYNLGDFSLEDGENIPDCKLAYATFGELNDAKDNAILIPTWFSGTSKAYEPYIGSGRALDPEKYFIVIVNQIGNGLSSSPHNTPAPFGMAHFPNVRIGDDVRAQHKFITEKYGIQELALVVGGSMGAQQTYEWAVRYPDMVKRAAPIAGTAKNTSHDFLFTETLNEAITSDPNWNGGNYQSCREVADGLKRHAKIWSVMGLSTEFYKKEGWRLFGVASLDEFIAGFLEPLFIEMDPNALLSMGWKWQRGDVSRNTNGNLQEALGQIKAKVYVMPIDEDMFFPPRDCEEEQKMIPNSELKVIRSICGHFALFAAEGKEYTDQIDKHLSELLAEPVLEAIK